MVRFLARIRISANVPRKVFFEIAKFHRSRVRALKMGFWQNKYGGRDPDSFSATVEELLRNGLAEASKNGPVPQAHPTRNEPMGTNPKRKAQKELDASSAF